MASMMPEPVQTFSVGFADRASNELPYARVLARAIGARHHEVLLCPDKFFAALPRLIWHEDEPIAFPSSVPLYFVSRLARDHVKVVLTGEGSDEIFLGYPWYRVTAWNDRLGKPYWDLVPENLRRNIAGMIRRLPKSLSRYGARSFLALNPGPRGLFYENFAVFSEPLQQRLLSHPESFRRDPYGEVLRCFEEAGGSLLGAMSRADLQTYLVELLMKQDQMSMAASIESRVPFLDHEFVEHAVSLPDHLKLHGLTTKAVLRAALKDILPAGILTRRKMGFPTPLGGWLRGPFASWIDEFVLSPRALARGYFDPSALRRLADEHRSGRAEHGDRLWLLMNLEVWQRIFIDGEEPETAERRRRLQGKAVAGAPFDAALSIPKSSGVVPCAFSG
jgi:asparagine synthase (glutamine-hydrolysing)